MKNSLILIISALWGSFALAQTVAEQMPQVAVTAQSAAAHPFFRSEGGLKWSALTASQALADAREAVRLTRERVQAIYSIAPEDATFDNTFLAVEEATDELQCVMMLMMHLSYVADSAENRAAMEEISALMSDCTAEIFSNEQLWHLMQCAATPEKTAGLSPAKQRAVKQLMQIFVDNGANLSAEKKALKNELEKEMMMLSLAYDKNIQDFTQNWELLITDVAELDGLPSDVLQVLQKAAADAGYNGFLITLRDETAPMVMAFCRVEQTRKKCWEGVYGYGVGTQYDNAPVIAALMEKRQEFAELLGFKNYADYEARTRMVQHGDEALAFVDSLIAKLKPAYDEELRGIMKSYCDALGKTCARLNPWDELQALGIYNGHKNAASMVGLSAYFKSTDVLNGLFSVYSNLLGVSFKQLPAVCLKPGETCPEDKVEVWHPDVKCVAMYDTATGTLLGVFYLDLYRRADKRAGAWCAQIRQANPGPNGEIVEPHVAALMANFDPKVKGMPNLFSHEDVIVLFHEFGHLMHHLLSHTELKGHGAMGVAWDFNEFPSTLSENWAWSPEVLATFARHYKTRKPCPQSVLERLAESRSVLQAHIYMETLRRAKLDLEIHIHYKDKFKGRSLDAVSAELAADCQLPYASMPYSPLRNLPHCFAGGYAAGVYSYLWSEVLAADAYTRFAEEGMLNPAIGKQYRETILEKGDSLPADELYRMFMGRNPDEEAFLKVHKLNR